MTSIAAEAAGADRIVAAIERQIEWCRTLGSNFTANILELVRDNVARGGAIGRLVLPWHGDPLRDVLSLRLAGALHAMVRAGLAGDLAAFYPPKGREPWDATRAAHAIEVAVAANMPFVRDFISRPPQTNEIGRSAILMPGYAMIAAHTGLALRVLELGASAGLNLMWDRYAYRYGERVLGAGEVTVAAEWRGAWPGITQLPRVVARAGCDRTPIDIGEPGAADRLLSYVWPDQAERLTRLEAALELARREKPAVEQADAADWLERQLASPAPGVATVVAHTIVWMYFSRDTAARARAALTDAGARATAEAPLAWLAFEHVAADQPPFLKLTLWPGGETRTLARCHPHGQWIEWLA